MDVEEICSMCKKQLSKPHPVVMRELLKTELECLKCKVSFKYTEATAHIQTCDSKATKCPLSCSDQA